jgi:hypothetical protein
MDDRPLHLVAKAGDRRSICGIKDPLPVCLDKFGQVHRVHHRTVCGPCFEGAGLCDCSCHEVIRPGLVPCPWCTDG